MAQSFQGRFIQDGLSIDYTPGSAVAAGDVVVQNNVVGIAKTPIAASILGALAVTGIFDVVKDNSDVSAGDSLFWDADGDPVGGTAGTGACSKTRTSNTFMGFALEDAGAGFEKVRMILRSVDATSAETLSLADLSDIGALVYTAGLTRSKAGAGVDQNVVLP